MITIDDSRHSQDMKIIEFWETPRTMMVNDAENYGKENVYQ